MWECVCESAGLRKLWSHLAVRSEQGQGQQREICPALGVAKRPGFPPSPACQSPGAGQGLADDFFLPCHQCKYISLSALLTVIREERGGVRWGGKYQDRGADNEVAGQPGGRKREKQEWQQVSLEDSIPRVINRMHKSNIQ